MLSLSLVKVLNTNVIDLIYFDKCFIAYIWQMIILKTIRIGVKKTLDFVVQ